MKRVFSMNLFGILLGLFGGNTLLLAEDSPTNLFYKGKNITKGEISPAFNQKIYDAQLQYRDAMKQIYQEITIEKEIEAEAAAKKISNEAARKNILKGAVASEKQAKEWYEENKGRLGGRSFDSIKSEIIAFLSRLEEDKAAKALIEKLEKSGVYKDTLEEPKPFTVDIKVNEFPKRGATNSKVKVVEFADYRCPHCIITFQTIEKLVEKYKHKVEFTYVDFPLSDLSIKIASGGVCSDQQKKFWEYYSLAFKANGNLNESSPEAFAKELKLDMAKFNACVQAKETTDKVVFGQNEGRRIGVSGTPAVYINGVYQRSVDEKDLAKSIEALF